MSARAPDQEQALERGLEQAPLAVADAAQEAHKQIRAAP